MKSKRSLSGATRACLPDVIAEHLSERGVQQVGRRVVARGVLPVHGIDPTLHRVALRHASLGHPAEVDYEAGHDGLRVGDLDPPVEAGNVARIADLAAPFRIERGLQQHDFDLFTLRHLTYNLVARDEPDHHR